MRLKNLAILLVGSFVLCSCAVHNTDFIRCKNAQGQKCTSVSKIDKMIDRGLITDDDDEHSYHFRGKPELLAGISEENLLEQLEIEYLGDITSCNKVSSVM